MMIQSTKSEIYCGTQDSFFKDFNQRIDDDLDFKLYSIALEKYNTLVNQFIELLTADELARANNYYFKKDKNRFIICRTLLKSLLAEKTGLKIDEIHLDYLHNKKPYLPSHPSVFFNVSHSGKHALIAIGKDILGVDLEFVNKENDYTESLPDIFSKEEIDLLIKADNKAYIFYKFWTRKEAIVKATGKGINENLSKIPVIDGIHSVDPYLINNFRHLSVFSFDLDEQHIAAIAYKGKAKEKLSLYPIPTTIESLTNLIKF